MKSHDPTVTQGTTTTKGEPSLTFHVVGTPCPKGSWIPIPTKTGKVVFRSSSKGEPSWSDTCAWLAKQARTRDGWSLIPRGKSVQVDVEFIMPRPAKPINEYPVGDLDKLLRSAFDAFSGILYDDDVQVSKSSIEKRYADANEEPGAIFTVRRAVAHTK